MMLALAWRLNLLDKVFQIGAVQAQTDVFPRCSRLTEITETVGSVRHIEWYQ